MGPARLDLVYFAWDALHRLVDCAVHCQAASHYGADTEKGKRYNKAGDDAQTFSKTSKPHTKTSQTVSQVMQTVSTSAPPGGLGPEVVESDDPQWMRDVAERAKAAAKVSNPSLAAFIGCLLHFLRWTRASVTRRDPRLQPETGLRLSLFHLQNGRQSIHGE